MLTLTEVTAVLAKIIVQRPCVYFWITRNHFEWLDCKPAGCPVEIKTAADMNVEGSVACLGKRERRREGVVLCVVK